MLDGVKVYSFHVTHYGFEIRGVDDSKRESKRLDRASSWPIESAR